MTIENTETCWRDLRGELTAEQVALLEGLERGPLVLVEVQGQLKGFEQMRLE